MYTFWGVHFALRCFLGHSAKHLVLQGFSCSPPCFAGFQLFTAREEIALPILKAQLSGPDSRPVLTHFVCALAFFGSRSSIFFDFERFRVHKKKERLR